MNKELVKAQPSQESEIVQSEAQSSNQDFSTVMSNGNIEELLEGVDKIESAKVLDLNIAMTYLDVEQNKEYRMRFCGFIEENYPDIPEPLKCAILSDSKKNLFKYGEKNFTYALERANLALGTDIMFCWTGLKKTQNGGNMRIHSVKPILKKDAQGN